MKGLELVRNKQLKKKKKRKEIIALTQSQKTQYLCYPNGGGRRKQRSDIKDNGKVESVQPVMSN